MEFNKTPPPLSSPFQGEAGERMRTGGGLIKKILRFTHDDDNFLTSDLPHPASEITALHNSRALPNTH